jgi:hypothetical protein
VDSREFNNLLDRAMREVKLSWTDTGNYFHRITPRDTGNARRNTRLKDKQILADYGYAGRLDEGWSKQAPTGMSDPSIDFFERDLNERLGRL